MIFFGGGSDKYGLFYLLLLLLLLLLLFSNHEQTSTKLFFYEYFYNNNKYKEPLIITLHKFNFNITINMPEYVYYNRNTPTILFSLLKNLFLFGNGMR